MEQEVKGPITYENWKACILGEPALSASEYPLFTDAQITAQGMDGYGPYQFINAIRLPDRNLQRSSVVLRAEYFLKYEFVPNTMERTDYARYHGGWFPDEMAALASLCMGIRLKSGPASREFEPGGDPRGFPVSYAVGEDPIVPQVLRKPVLPSARGFHSLEDLAPIASFPKLAPDDANVLIRSARLYQDGLWIAEAEPHLTWLMLVSAIETVADHHISATEDPVESLKLWKLDFFNLVKKQGDDKFVGKVARALQTLTGSTRKFVDFVIKYIPPPPENRPAEFEQVSWSEEDMRKMVLKIYKYRSDALHGGTPFPAPMCEGPFSQSNGVFGEKPIGLAMQTKGGTWLIEDIPMLLQTFEYIVRHVILNWWTAKVSKHEVTEKPTL